MSAAHVFSIIELLQQILGELPPLDIIRCQRVNSTWKQLIANSPLLQYQAWLRNDIHDPSYRIQAEDFHSGIYKPTEGVGYDTSRYISTVSQHLHPIVVVNIMKHLPDEPGFSFDPISKMHKDGFGGYFNLRPILLRELRQWYERNKATEHVWGNMSLYRPDARKIRWSIPDSDGAGIPVDLKACPVPAEKYNAKSDGYEFRVNKGPGMPLVLTVGDLMRKLDYAWRRWIESEEDAHYLSHDSGPCDFDRGIPGARCLESDDEDGDVEEGERETYGTKMTMEEHIEQAMEAASS